MLRTQARPAILHSFRFVALAMALSRCTGHPPCLLQFGAVIDYPYPQTGVYGVVPPAPLADGTFLAEMAFGPGLTHYLADGTIDTSFSAIPNVSAFAVLPNGEIAAGGESAPTLQLFHSDGTPDIALQTSWVGNKVYSLVAQADSKIAFAGCVQLPGNSATQLILARWQTNGQLDSAFGVDGVASLHTYSQDVCSVGNLVSNPDGSFTLLADLKGQRNLLALSAVGAVEGMRIVNPNSAQVFLENGLLYLQLHSLGSSDSSLFSRYSSVGALDTSFGIDGTIYLPASVSPNQLSISTVLADGRTLVAGFDSNDHVIVSRFLESGEPDMDFGIQGESDLWQTNPYIVGLEGIFTAPDGTIRIVVTLYKGQFGPIDQSDSCGVNNGNPTAVYGSLAIGGTYETSVLTLHSDGTP